MTQSEIIAHEEILSKLEQIVERLDENTRLLQIIKENKENERSGS